LKKEESYKFVLSMPIHPNFCLLQP